MEKNIICQCGNKVIKLNWENTQYKWRSRSGVVFCSRKCYLYSEDFEAYRMIYGCPSPEASP